MTAINFPDNPQVGDTFLNFAWDGEKWRNAGSQSSAVVLKDLFEFSVAADDSTQRTISTGESVKFIGAGTVTTASDAEGNITITGAAANLTGYATETFVTTRGYLTSVGTVSYNDLSNKPILFSGSYTDLTNKPTIPTTVTVNGTAITLDSSGSLNSLTNGSDTLSLDGASKVNLPGGTASIFSAANVISLSPDSSGNNYFEIANNVGISLYTNRAFELRTNKGATDRIWSFNQSGSLTFPDNTTQTTAYTTTAAKGLFSAANNSASGSGGSLSYTNGVYTFTPALNIAGNAATVTNGVYTTDTGTVTNTMLAGSIANAKLLNSSVTVNGTSVSLGASATVTAAAGTLTGTTLNSTVVTSSLTSVGTLTSLTTSGAANITYTPGTATGYGIQLTGKDTQGGVGYFDFLKITNTTAGVSNASKSFRMTSTGTIEIINSAYTQGIFGLSDTGHMSVSGSYQVAGKQAVNGPAFRAFVAVGQTLTSGSQQKVTFGSETFDTNSNFASSRFTPTLEGYYQLNATVRIGGGSSTGECMMTIWKNGSEYARGTNESGTEQGASFYSMQVSDIAYANGTTDYFEIYIQQTSGSNKDTTAGTNISYFSGCMIRGA